MNKKEMYPNPLQIELKDGSVSVGCFMDSDGAGVVFRFYGSPHEIGSKAGDLEKDHQPQKGEVYIKCFNKDSFQVLKDHILKVGHLLN